jgi:hypothetical protein
MPGYLLLAASLLLAVSAGKPPCGPSTPEQGRDVAPACLGPACVDKELHTHRLGWESSHITATYAPQQSAGLAKHAPDQASLHCADGQQTSVIEDGTILGLHLPNLTRTLWVRLRQEHPARRPMRRGHC